MRRRGMRTDMGIINKMMTMITRRVLITITTTTMVMTWSFHRSRSITHHLNKN